MISGVTVPWGGKGSKHTRAGLGTLHRELSQFSSMHSTHYSSCCHPFKRCVLGMYIQPRVSPLRWLLLNQVIQQSTIEYSHVQQEREALRTQAEKVLQEAEWAEFKVTDGTAGQ